jgi:molybdopterin converting factor small subunit
LSPGDEIGESLMKIDVEFLGLPMVSDVVGKKKLEVDIAGGTVKDVIDELIRRYGKKVRDALYDGEGRFDVMIQIALNEKTSVPPDKHGTLLKEGDRLIFMLLLAGG